MTGFCQLLLAAEAERVGLVNRVVPQDALFDTARDVAKGLTAAPRQAIHTTKAAVNKIVREQVNPIFGTSLPSDPQCFDTDEHRAVVRNFLDSRK